MERVLILGSAGAGKTILAKRIHDKTGLPIINMDKYFWKPGWIREDEFEFRNIIERLSKEKTWIMDGNHRKTLDVRLPRADTVILLDFPRLVCFGRILKRRFTKNRLDTIKGCDEKIDFEFLYWILWKYPQISRKANLETIKENNGAKKTFILKSNKDIERFLSEI